MFNAGVQQRDLILKQNNYKYSTELTVIDYSKKTHPRSPKMLLTLIKNNFHHFGPLFQYLLLHDA